MERPFELGSLVTTIEQKPFDSLAVRSFFTKWCQANDDILPHYMPRRHWKPENTLQPIRNGVRILNLPTDLSLWEMVDVIEKIDTDTFAHNPKRQTQKSQELRELGNMFTLTGEYLATYAGDIKHAKPLIAKLYNYGVSLSEGRKSKTSFLAIPTETLTNEDKMKVDEWLLGPEIYKNRMSRLAKQYPNGIPESVKDTIRTRITHTVFQTFNHVTTNETNSEEPWKANTGLFQNFQERLRSRAAGAIEQPGVELHAAIFRRGMELLRDRMPFDTLPPWVKNAYLHWQKGERSLREALQIDRLRQELAAVRASGDIRRISKKERSIATQIYKAINYYTYEKDSDNPSDIIATQTINCLGRSILGGALLEEAGVNYLTVDVPNHSVLMLITAGGQAAWMDLTNYALYSDIKNKDIISKNTVADIVAFSRQPTTKGLTIEVTPEFYKKKKLSPNAKFRYVTVFPPEYGQKIVLLHNLGVGLASMGLFDQAGAAYEEAMRLGPNDWATYNNLGMVRMNQARLSEAVTHLQRAASLNPLASDAFYNLASAFWDSGQIQEAARAAKRFLELAPPDEDIELIKKAQAAIKEAERLHTGKTG